MSATTSPGGRRVTIGVDFGTESGRVLLLEMGTGEELAVSRGPLPQRRHRPGAPLDGQGAAAGHGASGPRRLPGSALPRHSRGARCRRGGGSEVIGLGIDFTSCTVLPVTADGTPLCQLETWRDHPACLGQALEAPQRPAGRGPSDRSRDRARRARSSPDTAGGLSSEWYFPKLIELWQRDRPVYEAMSAFVEATDWVVWHLTGTLVRASCSAGYKAFWSPSEGLPSQAYFEAAYPGFPDAEPRSWERLLSSGPPRGVAT